MDLKRMLYFCTIAEQGQVSRAATLLHMAQPPLSQRLRELEEELGCALFTRHGRALRLTEAGSLFYRRAREILRAVDETRDEVIRLASHAGPTLRIGLSPTGRDFLCSRLGALRTRLRDYQIGLIVGDSSYLEYLLRSAQLDVALMQAPVHPEHFVIHHVVASRAVGVMPAHIYPDKAGALTLQDLSRHPLLLPRRSVGVGSYERLLQAFNDASLPIDIALYSSDVSLLLDLVIETDAIAVVPESETAHLPPGCKTLAIDVELPCFQLSAVCARTHTDPSLAEQLRAILAESPAGGANESGMP